MRQRLAHKVRVINDGEIAEVEHSSPTWGVDGDEETVITFLTTDEKHITVLNELMNKTLERWGHFYPTRKGQRIYAAGAQTVVGGRPNSLDHFLLMCLELEDAGYVLECDERVQSDLARMRKRNAW